MPNPTISFSIKNILAPLRSAIVLLLILTVLLGGVYPLVTTVITNIIFADNSSGSLIIKDGKVIGSQLIGQEFSEAKYFWGRLSAHHYNAMDSGGSNLSQANPKLLEAVNARATTLQKADPKNKEKIPVDLVTASASGLDPHISISAAKYQIGRIATARNMKPEGVQALIDKHIDWQSQIFGDAYVNVLELNLALDEGKK